MNKDWNPTDEDTWLSNAARELFGFPIVQEWVINPDWVNAKHDQDVRVYGLQPYQLETLKNFGVDWSGEDKTQKTALQVTLEQEYERQLHARAKAQWEKAFKPQPISEHRVCPYCGKEGVIVTNLELYEDSGAIHQCPMAYYIHKI